MTVSPSIPSQNTESACHSLSLTAEKLKSENKRLHDRVADLEAKYDVTRCYYRESEKKAQEATARAMSLEDQLQTAQFELIDLRELCREREQEIVDTPES